MIPIIFLIAIILYIILSVGVCVALIIRWRKMAKIEKILDEDLDILFMKTEDKDEEQW